MAPEPRPGVRYLDGARLARALAAGFARLSEEQEQLNQINVFPVPDGDTGANLAATVGAMFHALEESRTRHAGDVLTSISDAALDGARGNSGAILAQFFQGLADVLGSHQRIDGNSFAYAMQLAAVNARDALAAPKEGTIITVITATAKEMERVLSADQDADFVQILAAALLIARDALTATREQLDALRRAGVVDAGAMGFVLLLEGVTDFLHHGSLRELPRIAALTDNPARTVAHDIAADERYRFCTECLVTGAAIDRQSLRERLTSIGDSVVIAGSSSKIRVHLHTNSPAEAFELAADYGLVMGLKADDMHQQTRMLGHTGQRVAVMTDSAADLSAGAADDLDIHIVPLRIQFGESTYLDRITLEPDGFFGLLGQRPEHPSTSQPAPGDFRRLYGLLTSHFDEIVTIVVSSKLSGTWQAAINAARRIDDPDRITIIDSRNASLGQGLVVMRAAEYAQAGHRGAQLRDLLDKVVERTHCYGMLADLTHAVRGGRVRPIMKWLADRLRLLPIISNRPDGGIGAAGFLLGRRNQVRRFADYVCRRCPSGRRWHIAVAHAQRDADARDLEKRLRDKLESVESSFVTELGAAFGVHTGPGALVVAVQEADPPPGT